MVEENVTKTNVALTEQLELLSKIRETMLSIKTLESSEGVEDIAGRIREAAAAVATLGENSSNVFRGLKSQLKETAATTGLVSIGLAAVKTAIEGVASAATGPLAIVTSLFGMLKTAVSWAFKMATAIVSIPAQMLGVLVDEAAKADLGMTELAQKIENVRGKFGDFQHAQSSYIKQMQGAFAKTTETGLGSFRVYGNLAERLEKITEMVEGLGSAFSLVSDELSRDGFLQAKRLDEFRMGLGLTTTDVKNVALIAKANGESLGATYTEITKHARAFGDMAGVSHKDLAKDMADAMKNLKTFGGVGAKEMLRASAYARKLGLELKEIAGVATAFETFDQAAEGAAKLGQAFGITVDAFKLVSAQSPDEMIDSLRKSFFAAGKSAEQLNRQELKLLASQTGISEEAARAAFSINNQGLSMEDLNKKMSESGQKQVTQAEALKDLADSIKRMVKEFGKMQSSFFKMFLDGFMTGIQRSKEFMTVIMNIRAALISVWSAGFDLGNKFIRIWGPTKKLFEGLQKFFDPAKFRDLSRGISGVLERFFKAGDKADAFSMLKESFSVFKTFFNSQLGPIKQMGEGIGDAIKFILKNATDLMKGLIEVLAGRKRLDELGEAGSTISEGMSSFFTPILNAIVDHAPTFAITFIDLIVTGVTALLNFLKSPEFSGMWSAAGDTLSSTFAWLKDSIVANPTFQKTWDDLKTSLSTLIYDALAGAFKMAADKIIGFVTGPLFAGIGSATASALGASIAGPLGMAFGSKLGAETGAAVGDAFANPSKKIDKALQGDIAEINAQNLRLAKLREEAKRNQQELTPGMPSTAQVTEATQTYAERLQEGFKNAAKVTQKEKLVLSPGVEIDLKDVQDATTISSTMTTAAANTEKATAHIKNSQKELQPALEAIKAIIKDVNMVNKDLETLAASGRVSANIVKVAGNLGLGGRSSFTVNQGRVQLNVGVTVEMRAAEVEKMIVFRKNSVIRDQIQWIRESQNDATSTAFSQPDTNKIPMNPREAYTYNSKDATQEGG